MKTKIPVGLSKKEYMKRYRKIKNPDVKKEIKNLKIKCYKCNRAYGTSFYLGKAYCSRCNPKPKKQLFKPIRRFKDES